ncbi:hypothetical protein [uncultured Methylobacterium sp.]|uniref:hypothetical protein n=1 Tax=uncultured Methylobacterium sp. TaxID=157278 RepID=UPI0035CB5B2D
MPKPDPFAALDGHGAGRLSLPFLPTLVTALALGAASLACREPAPAAPAPAASVEPRAFHAAAPAEAAPPRPPAAITFAQYPPRLALPEARAAAPPPPAARIAAAQLRRACTGQPCTEGPPRRPAPAATVQPAAVEAQAGTGDGLPDLALPFAPAARVVGEAAAFVRTGAASLGGSVSVLIDRLR